MTGKTAGVALIETAGGLLYLAVWALVSQHMYMELLGQPERSWFNRVRAWWVTRHSRAHIVQLGKVWSLEDSSVEPTPDAS